MRLSNCPIWIGIFFGLLIFSQTGKAYAAAQTTLSITPSSLTKEVGQDFTTEVVVNSGTNRILSADIIVLYDPNILEAITSNKGSFFTTVSELNNTIDKLNGKVTYSFYQASVADAKSGQGTLLEITFRPKAAGASQVSFDSADTVVYGVGEGNVLTSTQPSSVTISPAPTPTSAPPPTNTPVPNNNPAGGGNTGDGRNTGGGGGSTTNNSADLNGDGKVNIFDLSILLRNWGRPGQGDLNGSGKVDIFDLSILLRNWGWFRN